MNIKWKFAVLTVAICGLSITTTFTLWFIQKNEASAIAEQKGKETAQRIEKVLALKSGYYRNQANDYAYWSDLVNYVRAKDSRWAKDNLDGSLEEFGSNGIYVINTDKTIIYSYADREFLKDLYTVISKDKINTKESKELHFYAKTSEGIVEFFGSPIRHSIPNNNSYGYFFVAKHWDGAYIKEIEEIGYIKATIKDKHNENANKQGNTIEKDIRLLDIKGEQIGVLNISRKNELAQAIDDYTEDAIKVELAHAAIIIAIFMFLMSKYLTIPLTNISRALKQKEIEPIKSYLAQNNEYGNISRAINDSFESRAELKELNKELERMVQEEVEKNRQKDQILFQQSKSAAMGELISLIAHQWRQPLNAIGIIMQTAYQNHQSGLLSEKDMQNCTDKGMALINSMSSTIDNFRNFFLPSKEKELFYIENSLDYCTYAISALFDSINIRIDKNYSGKHEFFGHKKDFEQTILNLLLNAKDAIESGGVKGGVVSIVTTQNDENIIIEIADNGKGISQNIKDNIFNPYFTTKHQAQGVGLGLYMAKQVIEKHHEGKISASSSDAGAKFVIELPMPNTMA